MINRRVATASMLSLLTVPYLGSSARAEWGELNLGEGVEDFWLATDAYIYGYPLVTMEMTRRVITNVARAGRHAGADGPDHQAARISRCLVPRRHGAERRHALHHRVPRRRQGALGAQPPRHEGPLCLFPMLDGWTNVFQVPGKRTTGTGAQTYAITGPGWKGTLPAGVHEYKSPTSIVWLLGRIYCTGTPEDYAAVHALQDECKLVPLSAYGKPYTPPAGKVDPSIDMKTAVRDQVNRMDAVEYFTLLAELMKTNPPAAADAPALANASPGSASCPARTSTRASSMPTSPSAFPQVGFDRIMLQFKFSEATSRTSTAGASPPRPASTAPTT